MINGYPIRRREDGASAYIHGFNLYYGLRSKGWRRYYWLDLRRLVERLLRPGQQLTAVRYFTTRVVPEPGDRDKARRQNTYLEALETLPDLRIHFGYFLPAKPSPYDVWAASDIVEAVKARQATSHGVPKAAFIITMSRPRTLLGRQIEAALEEYGFPALGSRTTERVAYPQMAIEGGSVLDGRDSTARDEILALRDEIKGLINDASQ